MIDALANFAHCAMVAQKIPLPKLRMLLPSSPDIAGEDGSLGDSSSLLL
jgi:hypothetical protein